MRKRKLLLVAGACLATLTLTVGSAMADPNGAPTFRQLAGTGSDTTQAVLNGLSDAILDGSGTKIIGSYDAVGSAQITTKDPAVNPNCTFNRPNGSGQGVDALIAHPTCLDFARSSSNDSASRTGANLTYIPFAVDAVTYATRSDSLILKTLTVANLVSTYNCTNASIKPLLPHFGSGTRKFFLSQLGFTDSADFVTLPGHTCIRDKQLDGVTPLEENDGTEFKDPAELGPYSIANWIAQVNNQAGVSDIHGKTLLREIKNPAGAPVTPLLLNTGSVMARDVYDVVPTGQLGVAPTSTTFVGTGIGQTNTSAVCQNSATIQKYGFGLSSKCGDTSIKTP